MYENKLIHSQRKDHRWSSGATSPGFVQSTEPKQKQPKLLKLKPTFGIFLNSEPTIQTNLQRPLISKTNLKIPRINQNNNFMWKPKNTPNSQNWGFSQTSTKIHILYTKLKLTTWGSQIYLQFHRVTSEVAKIWLESSGPSEFPKILQNYSFS